ncbi:MAG: DUF2167 domain-containing protein [Alphaproteobacteria bacterium]
MQLFKANKHIRDNILFLIATAIVYLNSPTIVPAQQNPYNPINFTQALILSRGSLIPASPQSVYLNHEETCKLLQQESGWDSSDCPFIENIVIQQIPGIDSTIIMKPNSDGFVSFEDWTSETAKEAIDEIWESFVEGSLAQTKKIGVEIKPIKWIITPYLDKEKSYLYYAFLLQWGQEQIINVKASKFDRLGYVEFQFVPEKVTFSEAELTTLVEQTLATYTPSQHQSYDSFTTGDKVASVGALGVLATLVGVKYGKAAASGALALLLVFAKKLWFLVFLPFIWIGRKLFHKKSTTD